MGLSMKRIRTAVPLGPVAWSQWEGAFAFTAVVTLVLCAPSGDVLGQLSPFAVSVPWWQEAQEPVTWVRDVYGVDVTILRLLEARLTTPPGGPVTYLAEVDPLRAAAMTLVPWPGSLASHALRLPYAEPGGPARDLAWAELRILQGIIVRGADLRSRCAPGTSPACGASRQGGIVWLKCVPPFFAHEGEVLAVLHRAPVPRLWRTEKGGYSCQRYPGEDLYNAPTTHAASTLITMLVDSASRWSVRQHELAVARPA